MMEAWKRELAESWAGCLFCILIHIGHTECEVMRWGNIIQRTSSLVGLFCDKPAPIFHPKYACSVSVSVPHGLLLSARPLQMLFPLPHTLSSLCINILCSFLDFLVNAASSKKPSVTPKPKFGVPVCLSS